MLCSCITQARVQPERITITLDPVRIHTLLDLDAIKETEPDTDDACWSFEAPFSVRRRGVEARVIIGNDDPDNTDPSLIENLARAHHILAAVKQGRDFVFVSSDTNLSVGSIKQLLPMAFLAPDITRDIVQGSRSTALTSKWLQQIDLPFDWNAQRRLVAALD